MSISEHEPINEVKSERKAREKPRLPWQFATVGGFIAVEEGEGPGSDQKRRRKDGETAEDDDDCRQDHDHDDEREDFGSGVHINCPPSG